MSSSSKRITYKCTRPNPLFEEWLTTLLKEATETKSKLIPMLQEALNSISVYPLPLSSGAECAILKGFDKRLCTYLDNHLKDYNSHLVLAPLSSSSQQSCSNSSSFTRDTNNENDQCSSSNIDEARLLENQKESSPKSSNGTKTDEHPIQTRRLQNSRELVNAVASSNTTSNSSNISVLLSPEPKKNSKAPKAYKPAYRSGGYAILIALLEHSKINVLNPILTQEEIIERAEKYCEESFVRPKPGSYYTAWSSMANLIAKGLVVRRTRLRKAHYSITEQGLTLANELLNENVNRATINDIIFNSASSSTPVNVENNTERIAHDSEIGYPINMETNESLIEMEAGSFDIILLIDKNETGGLSKKSDPTVTQFKKYPDLKHEYRSLKVGDFIWIAKHNDQELVLPYVIERKRMDDLGASIKDGRFHEQKFRLRKCGLDNVIYLIEHYGSNTHVGLPMQSLMQAIANTRVQDGFKVHFTTSLTNSVRFLAIFTKRLTVEFQNKSLTSFNRDPSSYQLMSFEYFNKSSVKTKPLTVTEAFIKMLLQLKGVSLEKALAITKEYSTPRSLMAAYEKCSLQEGQLLVANLKHGDLSRNVGPNTSKAIYHLFTNVDGD